MQILQIDIGKCEILIKKNCLIKIVLGSCIGVIIFNEQERIIGAIHILLPNKHKYSSKIYSDCAFADRGLNYLLNQIKNKLKQDKKLKAVIAGGSDLEGKDYFSIGLANYKYTVNFLIKNNIEIIYEDCLGNKPRVLEFNTNNFSYKVYDVTSPCSIEEYQFDENKFLKDIKNYFSYLPVMSQNILKLLSLLKDDNVSFYKLEEIIKTDDALTLNLLKYVNSSYYSPANKITDIKQALMFLGIKKFYNFISNEILNRYVTDDLLGYMIEAKFYKMHVISVALLSEYIADLVGENSSEAYIAGLFHDIGKLILDRYALENYKSPERLAIITFVEKSLTSFAHALIGAEFIKNAIGVVKRIYEAIEFHHYPSLSSTEYRKFVSIIALSNSLISNFLFGTNYSILNVPFKGEEEIYNILNISIDDVKQIIENIPFFISISEELVDETFK